MEIKRVIKDKITKINDLNNIEAIRCELYSIFTTLLLSKEEFKCNKDINEMLKLFDMEFKEYVLKNRTAVIARVIRFIEKANDETIIKFKNILFKIYISDDIKDITDKSKQNKGKNNYMESILAKYSRGK